MIYKTNGGVLADDKPTAAGHRGGILVAVDGVAVKADDLLAMKKDEGREFVMRGDSEMLRGVEKAMAAESETVGKRRATVAARRAAVA